MESNCLRITFGSFLLLLIIACNVFAAPQDPEQVAARVGKLSITVGELREYAMKRPDLITVLTMHNAGRLIAETWIQERAVALYKLKTEGEEPYKAIEKLSEGDISKIYVETITHEITKTIKPTDQDALSVYKEYPEKYAIPTRVHLQQMVVTLDQSAGNSRSKALEILKKAKEKLEQGMKFDEAYDFASRDIPNLGKRDYGFIPLTGEYEGTQHVEELQSGEANIVKDNNSIFLFFVSTRRNGFLEPFENLKELIKQDLWKQRVQIKKEQYIRKIKQEFGTEILF